MCQRQLAFRPRSKKASASERIIEFSNGLLLADAFSNIFFFSSIFMSFEWRIYVVQGSSVLYGIASRVMSSRESWNCCWSLIKTRPSQIPTASLDSSQFSIPRQSTRETPLPISATFIHIHKSTEPVLLSVYLRFLFFVSMSMPFATCAAHF